LIVKAYRITKAKHSGIAFDGEGAKKYSGRWNSVGTAMVYTAGHLSLAIIEILAHLKNEKLIREKYVYFELDIDENLIKSPHRNTFPANWNEDPAPSSAQLFGGQWVASRETAVLQVPSAIVDIEYNYLLNPLHPSFKEIKISAAKKFEFDPRLLSS
jgi:RES domain-containing protein